MTTLYVTDMDGTLLDNNSRVSLESADIISRLTDRGALITVATARTAATVEPLLAHTRIALPAIVMTGAAMWDRQSQRYTDVHFMSGSTATLVREVCRQHGIEAFEYTMVGDRMLHVYQPAVMSARARAFADERRHLRGKVFMPGDADRLSSDAPTVLFFAMGDNDRIRAVADRLSQVAECSAGVYSDSKDRTLSLLEVFGPGVSKAGAMRLLAERTGADRIVAFGDNINDLSMLSRADCAIAVANAMPEVRRMANRIIGSNANSSVARYIAYDFRQTALRPR